eukprot:scaffold3134_cov182-Amphora_coffeaeformis.AAC.1
MTNEEEPWNDNPADRADVEEEEEVLASDDETEGLLGEERQALIDTGHPDERAAKPTPSSKGITKWWHLLLFGVLVVVFVVFMISPKKNLQGNDFVNGSNITKQEVDVPKTTAVPTVAGTLSPTTTPTTIATTSPTKAPTVAPTDTPTKTPTTIHTNTPTSGPTISPTSAATINPTTTPTTAFTITSQQEDIDLTSPAYQNPNDQPFSPPKWIQSYVEFHNSQVKGDVAKSTLPEDTRWIQWYCSYFDGSRHCGGLADRLKGMFESLLFGVLDRRVSLLEEWEDPPHPLLLYLEPGLIDWSAQPTQTKGVNDTVELDAVRARPKTHVMYDVIHVHPCDFSKRADNHTGIRYTGNYFTKSTVIKKAPCAKRFSLQYDPSVQSTIFWTLFRFSQHIHDVANRLRGPINTKNYYVAAHIRTGNGTGWTDLLKHSDSDDWDTFSQCITIMQDAMEKRCGGHRPLAYLASDNQEAKEHVQAQHPPGMVHAPEVEIMHIDRSQAHELDNATAAYDAVVGEFKILLDSTCLIGSDSGFSRLARDLSRQQPRCSLMYHECADPEIVKQAVNNVVCPW